MQQGTLEIAGTCRTRVPVCYAPSQLWEPLKFRRISLFTSAAEIP